MLSRPWWRRWEIAAALLVIAVLGGYLAVARMGRPVSPLSRLSAITVKSEETGGTALARLRIGAIGIDTPIERVQSFPDDLVTPWAGNLWATGWQDGGPVLIPEPSDPWKVAWLADSAAPGAGGNVVLYGHLEYWDTAHAVFWNLKNLVAGDQIDVADESDVVFTYAVEWSRRFPIDVEAEQQRAILGPTDEKSLTLITSAGEYDAKTGLYPEVLVVRARLMASTPASAGDLPVRLRIEPIGLDALVAPREPLDANSLISVDSSLVPETTLDEDWILISPRRDPGIVAWREESAALGGGSNIVLEGRLVHSWTKPAVFWSLNELHPGDPIEVFGADGTIAWYEVEWLRRFPVDVDPRQRLDVLGPTEAEKLTLLTNAGELDRESGLYREVLVVRANFIGTTPLSIEAVPDPSECLTSPQSVDALEATVKVISKPTQAPTATPLTELTGEPADGQTIERVIAAETELAACLNANDPLRTYSLYTADGLARLLQYIGGPLNSSYEWVPDFSELAAPATPRTVDNRLALIAVEDVRVLPDGRIAALVTIGPQPAGMLGVPTGIPVVHILVPGDRYLIDEFIVPGAEP